MDHDTWCTCFGALLRLASEGEWVVDQEPTACHYAMHTRVHAFWIPLANTFRRTGAWSLSPTPRWVARYELQCLHRWHDRVRTHVETNPARMRTWTEGIEACRTFLNAYDQWIEGVPPPADWESAFPKLVADVFDTDAGTFPARPTMVRFWFQEFVRFWVPRRFGATTAERGDLDSHLRTWMRELDRMRQWIHLQVARFVSPNWERITRTQTTLRIWDQAYDEWKHVSPP